MSGWLVVMHTYFVLLSVVIVTLSTKVQNAGYYLVGESNPSARVSSPIVGRSRVAPQQRREIGRQRLVLAAGPERRRRPRLGVDRHGREGRPRVRGRRRRLRHDGRCMGHRSRRNIRTGIRVILTCATQLLQNYTWSDSGVIWYTIVTAAMS